MTVKKKAPKKKTSPRNGSSQTGSLADELFTEASGAGEMSLLQPSRVELKMSDKIDQLAKALVGFQADIQVIEKDSEGYNYDYLSLGGLLQVIAPILKKHKLAIPQFPVSGGWWLKWVDNEDPDKAELIERHQLGVLTMLLHESGQYLYHEFVMPMPEMSGTNTAQEAGAGITYARRYGIQSVLRLASADTDAT